MKLSMWNIYSGLPYKDIIPMIKDGSATIAGARWIVSSTMNPNTVYVGSAQELFTDWSETDCFIVHRYDMILVRNVDAEELFDNVCDIIDKYNEWDRQLSACLDEEDGLQKMIDKSRDVLQNPSYLYDPEGAIMAMASDYPASVHWHWKELIDNHGISEKRMKFFKDNINISSVFDDLVPTRRTSVMDEYEYIHCSVLLNRRIIGHYVLFGFTKPIAQGVENLVDILIGWMDLYVERHAQQFNPKSRLADAFVGFLEKREYDRTQLTELFNSFRWKISDPYQILAVQEIVNSEPVLLSQAFRRISETIPDLVVAQKDQQLIILRNLGSGAEADDLKRQLDAVFKEDFVVGASSPFIGIENSELYYRQALEEVERCRRSGIRISTGRHHLLDYLDDLFADNDLARAYADPVLTQLKLHDAQNGTEYYETFRAFCICGFHKSETSEMLALHRNSLNYRLDRIAELIGNDTFLRLTAPGDPDRQIRLIFSCFLLDKADNGGQANGIRPSKD